MDDRSKELLKVLVERYIADGQPVGSRSLSKVFDLSPATIRNVMADLEDLGFIHSPHTSAGRVPTPRGYRMFVDGLLTSKTYAKDLKITEMIPPSEPGRAVTAAASLLSNLSQFAGVVLTPKRTQVFRHIEFLHLSDKRVLLIIVTPDGDVQNRILFVNREYKDSELLTATNFFNHNFSGKSFHEVRMALADELSSLRGDISKLMQQAVDAGFAESDSDDDSMVISGEGKLLGISEMTADMDRLRRLFALFEQKTDLLHLLDVSSRAQGVQIYIGGDSQLVPLEDVSVITAPYKSDGKVIGTLGVIGPSRMAYDRVIPIVDITARLLSNALGQTN